MQHHHPQACQQHRTGTAMAGVRDATTSAADLQPTPTRHWRHCHRRRQLRLLQQHRLQPQQQRAAILLLTATMVRHRLLTQGAAPQPPR